MGFLHYYSYMTEIKRLALTAMLAVFTATVSGQTETEDSLHSGQGEDSLQCARNIGLYTKCIRAWDFQGAYSPWMYVFRNAPLSGTGIYTDGTKILHALIADTKDEAQKRKYFNELMDVYDKRIEHLDTLNALSADSMTAGRILREKAHDYVLFAGTEMDIDKAYDMINGAMEAEEETEPEYFLLQDLVNISAQKLKNDDTHKEQFIWDYLTASDRMARLGKAAGEKERQQIKIAKDNIDARFVGSGVANCENIQAVYGAGIERNRNNLEYLKRAIFAMQRLRCTSEDAYYAACEAAHAMEPTAATALGCAYMYYRKDSIDQCLHFFDESVRLEKDTLKKADNCYNAAVALYSRKQLSKAREYADRALSFNGKYGKAYLLIAQMYASSPNWSDEATLNKCTYYAVIDKLQLAKSADPGLSEEVQKLTATYAALTPKEEDLFFLGLKKGNVVSIGGWINEKTTIR